MTKLILGDCFSVLDELIAKGVKVDLILTDPPYGLTKNKRDNALPFDLMWEKLGQMKRNENTPILLFSQGLFYVDLVNSNRKQFKYDIVWDKTLVTGFLNAKKMPLRSHETIAVFYEKIPCYNPQFSKGNALHGRGTAYKNKVAVNNNYGDFGVVEDDRVGSTVKYPKSIISFKKPHPATAVHPTEKPVDLLEYLIKTYSNEGDIVLDFTMGSGSTGVACTKTNRGFIGIEKDETYFEIAKERIN